MKNIPIILLILFPLSLIPTTLILDITDILPYYINPVEKIYKFMGKDYIYYGLVFSSGFALSQNDHKTIFQDLNINKKVLENKLRLAGYFYHLYSMHKTNDKDSLQKYLNLCHDILKLNNSVELHKAIWSEELENDLR
ncbi:MAG: hypothetical protein WC955_10710 [Elusimicrobiota bacterium]